MNAAAVNWQDENRRYDRPHPRLREVAKLIRARHARSVLDLGCATAALRRLLPADVAYYGSDVTDDAAAILPAGHFLQADFNRAPDLSMFAGLDIEVVHIGGVLEYLERPIELLRIARGLVGPNAALLVTMINFDSDAYRDPATHHLGWIFKPTLAETRRLLEEAGWRTEQQSPVFLGNRLTRSMRRVLARLLGSDHAFTRHQAEQFILSAAAL